MGEKKRFMLEGHGVLKAGITCEGRSINKNRRVTVSLEAAVGSCMLKRMNRNTIGACSDRRLSRFASQ